MPAPSSQSEAGAALKRRASPPSARPLCALVFALASALALLGGCAKKAVAPPPLSEAPPFEAFTDIPGVTAEEAAAVEALRAKYGGSELSYGIMRSMEAFSEPSGDVRGFAALVSGYMSRLFGLNIRARLYEWDELIAGLESGEIIFTGDLTPTEKRREVYRMSSPIAMRSIVYFRLKDGEPLTSIAESRPLRYGFLDGATTVDAVLSTASEKIEPVFLDNYNDAYSMLKNGQIDAFFEEGTAKIAFEAYSDIVDKIFLPLIYEPVALTTQTPEFAPVISVMDKFLHGGGLHYLNDLYKLGERQYMANRLLSTLTDGEKAYLAARPTVKIAAEHDNYPISFYNGNEKQWQGIMIDILREIETLTGITFEIANDERTEFSELMAMLESGKVSMLTELIRSKEREGRFLWPATPVLTNRFGLISKSDRPNIGINEVLDMRVGIQAGTAHAEMFHKWFPGHAHTVEFAGSEDLNAALEEDVIDLAMSSQNQLLYITNYMEQPGYKINILFDYSFGSSPGFNKNERVLCAIVCKTIRHLNTDAISEPWLHKTYDYRVKLAQSRQPLLISVSLLLTCVIALLVVLFWRNRSMGRKLEMLVEERTSELHSQNKLMEAVTRNYKGVIWSVDRDGCITMFNGQYLKTIGVKPEFLLGKNLSLAREKNRHLDIIDNVEKTFSEGPQSWMCDIDGGVFHSSTTPISDVDGNIVGVAGSTDDITEMVRLSRELETALEAAKSANRAKSAFLANMSHEIRTPMNSIIGFSELALDYDMPEKPREYIGKILENSKWLLQIINDVLDVSKIEAGKMTLESIPFDLHEIFVQCRTATIPSALEKGLQLYFYSEPFVGRRLIGDPTRLRQIFINLISNAVKFTNIGAVKVSAGISKTAEDEVTVHFSVRDSGIGMTPEQMKKVLEPFAQADYCTTRKYGGTGLGLSIIKSFVEMMGGELTVESTPDVGTKFSFDLAFKTVDAPAETAEAGAHDLNGADIERPVFDGEILVCEDNAMNQEVARRHFERVGLRAVIADNGKAGVDMVLERAKQGAKPFDLIFMDINMPVMDGLEASSKIIEAGVNTPIVAMTANVMSSDRALYEKSGMHDCVGKPFTSQELWHCLLRYLKPVEAAKAGSPEPLYDDDLLTELRAMFARDNQNRFSEFANALKNGDTKFAHRLMHTLKGNAGTIGRAALQKAAAEAEKLLADGRNLLAQEHIDAVERELSVALRELSPYMEKAAAAANCASAVAAQPGATVASLEFAGELEALLRKGSPDCLKYIEALRAVSGTEELIRQMEDFDFDDAAWAFTALRNAAEGN